MAMQDTGQALFKVITCLSLLASIGSFVIAALPVLPHIASVQEHQQLTAPHSPESRAPIPPLSLQPARPRSFSEWSQAEKNEFVVRYGLWLVAFCAGALAVVRFIRIQRGDFQNRAMARK